jgi:hypothetical protein
MATFDDFILGVLVGVVTAVIASAITFYVKSYLEERAKFAKFKEKLDGIAGKNAPVIIPNIGVVKIVEISKQGLTVRSELCDTFIPMEKVLQTEIALPAENYDKILKETMRKNVEQSLDVMFPPLMEKLKEVFVQEFLKDDTEMSAILAFKVKGELKEEGYQVREMSEQKKLSLRQIAERIDKEEKSGKKTQPKNKKGSEGD